MSSARRSEKKSFVEWLEDEGRSNNGRNNMGNVADYESYRNVAHADDRSGLYRELELEILHRCGGPGDVGHMHPLVAYEFDLVGGKMKNLTINWIKFREDNSGYLNYGPALCEESMGKPYMAMLGSIVHGQYAGGLID